MKSRTSVFGGNTEKAVKWFQEYALLEQTGVADDRTIDSLYACWLRIMDENGYTVPDDEMEPQTAGVAPGDNPYGDGDDYGEDYGDQLRRLPGLLPSLRERIRATSTSSCAASTPSWPPISRCRGWKSGRTSSTISTRSGSTSPMRRIAPPWPPSQAFFTLWLEQQRIVLEAAGGRECGRSHRGAAAQSVRRAVRESICGPDGIILNERRTNHEYCQLQLPLLLRPAQVQRRKRQGWNAPPAETATSRKRWKC